MGEFLLHQLMQGVRSSFCFHFSRCKFQSAGQCWLMHPKVNEYRNLMFALIFINLS
jgi:hypothetical protein